ncbi:MAG: hypothetical protein ABI882_00630 [Acidobacteriota bacterium]
MSDPTHLITLQRTLEIYVQEKLRIQTELEGYERQVARCVDQLRTSDRMIDQARTELQNGLDSSRDQINGPYDPRTREPRTHERYDPRYDPRREPRYPARDEDRYDPRYERPGYRDVEPPPSYSAPAPQSVRPPRDIDEAIENLHREEEGSNVRFADFRIPQAATIVLREANEALHVSEIFRRMVHGGFEFRGQHQQITLAVSLTRSERFRKVAPGTFELDPAYKTGRVA